MVSLLYEWQDKIDKLPSASLFSHDIAEFTKQSEYAIKP